MDLTKWRRLSTNVISNQNICLDCELAKYKKDGIVAAHFG